MGIGAAIGGVASLLGATESSSASQSAAQTQASAANNATGVQQQMFQTIMGNEQPYMSAGGTALNSLTGDLSNLTTPINNTNWQQYSDPSYQFQLQQGQQALQNGQAAQDGAMSGAAQKALIGYNQNMANTNYNNAFNQYQTQNQNIYNRLAGLATLGQNAASATGSQGAGIAGAEANTITGAGNALAAGQIGSANAISGGLNNAAGYYMLNNLTSSPLNAGSALSSSLVANPTYANTGNLATLNSSWD